MTSAARLQFATIYYTFFSTSRTLAPVIVQRMFMKTISSLFFLLLLATTLYAQQPAWEQEEGEIDDAEVVIEKDREIELPPAARSFERVPPPPVTTVPVSVDYDFKEVVPQLPVADPTIKVLKIKEPPLDELFGNYAKVGFGNYLTPYLEFFANNTRNDEYAYGIHLEHLSSRFGPVDGANSGNSHTRVDLDGKYFAPGHTFSGALGYERNRFHFYGYDPSIEEPDRNDIKQIFNIFSAQGKIERTQIDQAFDYELSGEYDFLSDAYQASENQVGLHAALDYTLNEQFAMNLKSDLFLTNRTDQSMGAEESESQSRNLFRFNPYARYRTSENPNEGIVFSLGFNAVYENDTLENLDQFHLFPSLAAEYFFAENFSLYAGLDGDVERTSLLGFVQENPYLMPNVPLAHTIRTLAFRGGLKGRFNSAIGFHTGLSAGNYKNMYFFVNSAEDSTKFTILYDTDNTFLFNIFGELNFNSNERFRTTVRGDYYSYSVNQVGSPWHRPTARISVLSSYNVYEKLLFNAELLMLSGIEARNLESGFVTSLDPIVDLSFQADYLFSNRFSAFLQLKNILGQNYERYLNYPARGIMVIGGVSYSF